MLIRLDKLPGLVIFKVVLVMLLSLVAVADQELLIQALFLYLMVA